MMMLDPAKAVIAGTCQPLRGPQTSEPQAKPTDAVENTPAVDLQPTDTLEKSTGRRIAEGLVDSAIIGIAINTIGSLLCWALLGMPPHPAVIAVYMGIGTGVGAVYGPVKDAITGASTKA